MLVSPAEPKSFLELGDYSSLPETYGADFLAFPGGNTIGIQRKTCPDLVASIRDGRIARELHQMKELARAVLVVEGDWDWDGQESGRRGCEGFLRAQYSGIVLSAQANNVWVVTSTGIEDSIRVIRQVEAFLGKDDHSSLFRRPKGRGLWGTRQDRDWSCHVLQGWDGMGLDRAGALYDAHSLPLQWTISKEQMMTTPGIGKVTAEKLWRSLSDGATE